MVRIPPGRRRILKNSAEVQLCEHNSHGNGEIINPCSSWGGGEGVTECLCDMFSIKVTDVPLLLNSTLQQFTVGLIKTKKLESNTFSSVWSKITSREAGVGKKRL